jgi:nucleoside-diphosphate-sugar epimerase
MLFDAARGRHRVLVSSHSARPDAVSEYGISKYRMERLYLDEEETVVRPGLVLGAGGSFGRRLAAMRKSPVIPLVDGGRDTVPVLAVSDFCEAMVGIVEGRRRGSWNLFNQGEPTMREIVDLVLRIEGRRAWVVPVPYSLALAVVRAGERWLPVDSGSLRAMRLDRHQVHQPNLRELVEAEMGWAEAIGMALKRR